MSMQDAKGATHTPGPWAARPAGCHVDDAGIPTTPIREWQVPKAQAVIRVGSLTPSEAEANARLIAAAPDTAAERDRLKAENGLLLEALENIRAAGRNGTDPLSSVLEMQAIARTALAKAKGEPR